MILIYITSNSKEEAVKIGRHLLRKRLCGCVNIFENMIPIYWWPPKKGRLEEGKEAVLIVKTLEEKFKEIEKEVKTIHSDKTPCIFSIKVNKVSKPYFDWLVGEMNYRAASCAVSS